MSDSIAVNVHKPLEIVTDVMKIVLNVCTRGFVDLRGKGDEVRGDDGADCYRDISELVLGDDVSTYVGCDANDVCPGWS